MDNYPVLNSRLGGDYYQQCGEDLIFIARNRARRDSMVTSVSIPGWGLFRQDYLCLKLMCRCILFVCCFLIIIVMWVAASYVCLWNGPNLCRIRYPFEVSFSRDGPLVLTLDISFLNFCGN